MHNNLLLPGVILVPVPCANGVNDFIGTFDISCIVPSNITTMRYLSHSLFPFIPVLIHQVVVFSDPVYVIYSFIRK